MDILFENVTIVTMDPDKTVLSRAYLGVTGDKIVYVGSEKPKEPAKRTISGKDKVLIPGLVNAHAHIAMTALRGFADDQTLNAWLFDNIFPAEAKMNDRMVYLSARLGMMEAIASGTTAICDMYFSTPQIAKAAKELGIRANVGNPPLAMGDTFDLNDRSVSETTELLEAYPDDPLITVFTGVHSPHFSNPAVWRWVNEISDRYGLPVSMHMSETAADVEACRQKFGKTPAALLRDAGLFRHTAVAAHSIHVTQEDIEIMRSCGVSAASCPVSNLKLADGIAPLVRLKDAGVNIALGTDGVASNNSFDLFEEMKLSVLLQKNALGDAAALSAYDALYFATVGGNIALGRGDCCGRLIPGWDADLVMLDFSSPHLRPCYNTVSNIVYSARGSDVEMTMVRGRILYENRRFTGADPEQAIAAVENEVKPILSK